ncbi:hypothetical protein MPER_07798 [Moniliophthora perniciosa FA553]|nr:hypothetical protein MPER_07798 [Moniliophthora perniciosa FA553]
MEEVPDSQAPVPSPDIPIQPATTAENLPSQVVLTQLISVPSSGEAPDPSVIMDMAAKPPESDKGKKRAYEDQFADSSSVGPHARKRAKEGTSVLGDISAGEDSDYEQWPKRGKGSKPRQRIVNSDEESASDDPDKTNRVNSEGPQDATGKQQVDQVQTTTGKVTRSDKNGKPRKAEKRHQPAQKQKKHDIEGVGMNEGLFPLSADLEAILTLFNSESQLVNAPKPQKARKKKAKVPKQQV